jgi:MFS-type transporter involved in bile tolerance (Atg22 family)
MNIALSLLVLTAIALMLGAIALFRRGGYRKQAVLMVVLAAVMVMNIFIWTVPTPGSRSLSEAAQKEQAPE